MQLVNHVFALLILMPRFNNINFYQTRPKIKLFLTKKYKILDRCGLCPRNSPSSLQISDYAPAFSWSATQCNA